LQRGFSNWLPTRKKFKFFELFGRAGFFLPKNKRWEKKIRVKKFFIRKERSTSEWTLWIIDKNLFFTYLFLDFSIPEKKGRRL
jgi:hypothetical protein